jgi:hypothetical protein
MRKASVIAVLLAVGGGAWRLAADLEGSYVVPLDHPAIQYTKTAADDAVTRLNEHIAKGVVRLDFDERFGYLPAVLRELNVPLSSQVLVFSKTSFQASRISPSNPRALYFNDQVSVGWVPGGEVVELASVDPSLGVLFYTLDQSRVEKPRIERRGDCLQCHHSGNTLGVPGLMVRSVFPEPSGMPLFQGGTFLTDDRSPMKERWGGWYVTGTHGAQLHMGNNVAENREKPDDMDLRKGANVVDLKDRVDTNRYLTPNSDIVSLLVLEHQTRMTNLITRVGYEVKMALHDEQAINQAMGRPLSEIGESCRRRINNATETLLRYMLFTEESPLTDLVKGTSKFAEEFSSEGPRDPEGRSLRQFDLRRRTFRFPCSYMIYSEAFDRLPEAARDRIYARLWEVLTGRDTSKTYSRLSDADRKAIREILLATRKGLPNYWKA